ncbi:MDR family MFS transporter [Pseudalkalibacillus salsuginis]|uniref:MDR family MFS transporter n=1 Tax=Pseudalkalibacillus salsuginis TaxID=2910972 RepID=UPI001F1F4EA6|nr:MDR family MFS transporter [Pseudalkalibacillus salsuginis]MCF6409622.1 DHA2 family efflux MFS transporter permease subunit [Pseudalkalibacillus salsuginis]
MTQTKNNTDVKVIPLVFVLIMGVFIAILSQTLLGTALPPIMKDLQISASTAQWLQSSVLLIIGIMVPITAFLIGKFTTRQLFFIAMGSFTIGTAICAISPNFSTLLVGRVIQGAGAGIMMPLMQTILFVVFPAEKRGSIMGLFGLVITLAPAMGPTLSGLLVDHYPWSYIFWIILVISIIDLVCAYFFIKNVTEQTSPKVDLVSILFSSLGFGGLLYGFSAAGDTGWVNIEVLLTLIIGVFSLFIFIWRQMKHPTILEFRVFRYGVFALSTGITMIIYLSMIGATAILPIYMQNMHHYTATESGLMLLPGAIMMGIMSLFSGRLYDKLGTFGAKWLSILGLGMVTITTWMLSYLTTETTFLYLSIVYFFRMLGIGMVMTPITTLAINQLPKKLIPHGTAMNNTMRQIAGALGTAILITIMTNSSSGNGKRMDGSIDGVNMSFMVATILAAIGMILSIFLRRSEPKEVGTVTNSK